MAVDGVDLRGVRKSRTRISDRARNEVEVVVVDNGRRVLAVRPFGDGFAVAAVTAEVRSLKVEKLAWRGVASGRRAHDRPSLGLIHLSEEFREVERPILLRKWIGPGFSRPIPGELEAILIWVA